MRKSSRMIIKDSVLFVLNCIKIFTVQPFTALSQLKAEAQFDSHWDLHMKSNDETDGKQNEWWAETPKNGFRIIIPADAWSVRHHERNLTLSVWCSAIVRDTWKKVNHVSQMHFTQVTAQLDTNTQKMSAAFLQRASLCRAEVTPIRLAGFLMLL